DVAATRFGVRGGATAGGRRETARSIRSGGRRGPYHPHEVGATEADKGTLQAGRAQGCRGAWEGAEAPRDSRETKVSRQGPGSPSPPRKRRPLPSRNPLRGAPGRSGRRRRRPAGRGGHCGWREVVG
ncbi:unnamed protein product, partial [Ectocarpus sp. 12 AP-2014]